VWRIYEDVCVICAALWSGPWRSNAPLSYSPVPTWGRLRLDGADDLILGESYVRNLGLGIEGRPNAHTTAAGGVKGSFAPPTTARAMKRSSGMSWSSAAAATGIGRRASSTSSALGSSAVSSSGPPREDAATTRNRQVSTTLTLLQTFHAHTCFQLSTLQAFLPPPPTGSRAGRSRGLSVALTPKDVVAFELGPLSSADVRYLEWLAAEYGEGCTVVVKKGWRDLFGLAFGYG